MIKSNLDLENFCLKINKSDHIAIDTEFKRTDTFFPILCLIQIATDEFLEIIDPIPINNFQPLINLLKNHKITLILIIKSHIRRLLKKFVMYHLKRNTPELIGLKDLC